MSRRNLSLINEELNQLKEKQKEENNEVDNNKVENKKELIEIPTATLHGTKNNLKNIKAFDKIRQNYKLSNQKSIFLDGMRSTLDHLDVVSNKFNLEILIEVCNMANDFFIYGDSKVRENTKNEAIYELLLPYFLNDEVLEAFIISLQYKIKKSYLLKRLYKRLYKRVINFIFN